MGHELASERSCIFFFPVVYSHGEDLFSALSHYEIPSGVTGICVFLVIMICLYVHVSISWRTYVVVQVATTPLG